MPRRSHTVEDLAAKISRYLKVKDAAKRGYDRADRILAEIALETEPGTPIQLSAHRTARLIDKFAERKTLWGHGAVRPYEIEVTEL